MNEGLLDNSNLFVGCIIRGGKKAAERSGSQRGRSLNAKKEGGRRSSSFC